MLWAGGEFQELAADSLGLHHLATFFLSLSSLA
ncbi:MAG: hypothetical protein UW01_C0007G0030 [Candidatus Nomurabacteria bacterium GW2011_GWA2_43_66]|uniref:Uncharacterized protein n=1 Tax=Candidatus Nomurabacteria bacterium GW2011_GWF2_43_24 TaxID=1618778 RepID=A0A0G1GVE1_9BACT|nr:MAG: hypothetical protein UV13_C0002G0014 [Parcubacteria group bacterium GW2011_GWC1_42_21]KKS58636.1 MAG: hypothetical protein UV23_C0003G0020 [Candidatus Nomurabacteria bacterium GW2011_GWF1_42_40]KKT00399.1 MAG: hypothetical protein UV77_C0004G0031 [Candidatus Nomurabacteria bacterium GW2011_GWA1_43_17]KKT07541.1 MAG: hypothetical protein UV85_C0010G0019 [Candidatus Nomurabacteria bacterium GW2011_GWB1_43_19]KKT11352.1 MAG: hypothetical protein UV91_C0007G0052 [Candidatus Nomurabacteria b